MWVVAVPGDGRAPIDGLVSLTNQTHVGEDRRRADEGMVRLAA